MATKRLRPSGTWEYIIRSSRLLPKPLSLTFQSEEEGDAYVARLEQLLDAGIVPADVVEQREMISTTSDAIREYLRRVSVPDSDVQMLIHCSVGCQRKHLRQSTLNGPNDG